MLNLARRGVGFAKRVVAPFYLRYLHFRHRDARLYRPLEGSQFAEVERSLEALGIALRAWRIDPGRLAQFKALYPFPEDYHGGVRSGVWDEKLLEHFVSWSVLELSRAGVVYIDVAGASSPWAVLLRERGVEAFSVDMKVHPQYRRIPYHVECDATRLPWADDSVGAMSLQCAYEMFLGDSDTRFVSEAARVLKRGGKVVVVPLYMHTHACYYATLDYYGRDLGDAGATKYLRKDAWGVPASRKYSPDTLVARVLEPARRCGLDCAVHTLTNPELGGSDIYLKYFLTLAKPA